MDDDLRERVEAAAEKHALLNAVKHESEAEVGAVMGPLMGDNPDFREHADEVPGVVAPVVGEVNELSHEARRERLAKIAPDELAAIEADDDDDGATLPELPNVEAHDTVRMRCAPNPNGPWHLGHARMPAVIGRYKERYDGEMIVRFDDTDPETKRPDLDAYDAILDDVDYLGFEPDAIYRASDRLETYYDHGRELIERGGAYTCECPQEHFSELKNAGEACDHRDKAPADSLAEFEAMIEGEYDAGDVVLRVRTDIDHKNPALRDFVAFRLIDTPHPRAAASDYRCWPMLDFQSGVDDHLTGVTHIIRGVDLQDSAKKQRFVYDYFDWEYPEVVHWGHVQVDAYDVPMSTSSIRALIEEGELAGWDDPQAPTLQAARRRGIRGDAVVDAMAELGVSTANADLAMSSVYAANRDRVDDAAPRRFLVRDGPAGESDALGGDGATELQLRGADRPAAGHPPVHPDHSDRGDREVPAGDAVLVEAGDLPSAGERVWLKGYGPVRYDGEALTHTDDDLSVVREGGVDVIHWVDAVENVPVRLRTPDGDVVGWAEPAVADDDADDIVQFERVGFARIDAVPDGVAPGAQSDESDPLVAYFAHP